MRYANAFQSGNNKKRNMGHYLQLQSFIAKLGQVHQYMNGAVWL
jgi:hypothetical protein